jgi:hypothetical protein
MMREMLGLPVWVPALALPAVSAAASGLIWRAKGGDVADGIALGGILNLLGLLIVVVRRPRHQVESPAP